MLRYRVKRQIQTTARAKTETKTEKKICKLESFFAIFVFFYVRFIDIKSLPDCLRMSAPLTFSRLIF